MAFSPSEDCMLWAFGENYMSAEMSELAKIWNEKHGQIFVLKGTDSIDESLKKIIRIHKLLFLGD